MSNVVRISRRMRVAVSRIHGWELLRSVWGRNNWRVQTLVSSASHLLTPSPKAQGNLNRQPMPVTTFSTTSEGAYWDTFWMKDSKIQNMNTSAFLGYLQSSHSQNCSLVTPCPQMSGSESPILRKLPFQVTTMQARPPNPSAEMSSQPETSVFTLLLQMSQNLWINSVGKSESQ